MTVPSLWVGILQAIDPIQGVKSIGLFATMVLIFLGGVGFIVKYFIKALEKKDVTIERKDGEILKLTDSRREDLIRLESRLRDAAEAFKEGTNNLRTGFDDLKREVISRK